MRTWTSAFGGRLAQLRYGGGAYLFPQRRGPGGEAKCDVDAIVARNNVMQLFQANDAAGRFGVEEVGEGVFNEFTFNWSGHRNVACSVLGVMCLVSGVRSVPQQESPAEN